MTDDTVRVLYGLFLPALGARSDRPWQPPVDVYRVTDGWLVKFELAGVAPEDVTVTLDGRRVVVRGARLDRCVGCGCSVHQMEITYSRFERWVELPEAPESADVRCEFVHGMLLVHVQQSSTR
jgi:HSP20 family protein